jgi:hypothetical protein
MKGMHLVYVLAGLAAVAGTLYLIANNATVGSALGVSQV